MSMKATVIPFCLLFSFAGYPFASAQSPTSTTTLTIHTDQVKSKVSPTLYGLMTEEINHSYDGGLYAEMVSNGTFRSIWSGIPDWTIVEDGDSEAKMSLDKTTGPSAALSQSLKLMVAQASDASPAGVLYGGYWGMAVHPFTTYEGSFYAKEDATDTGAVTASLVANESGKILASATVTGVGTTWKKYAFTLKTGDVPTSAANHLVLTVAHAGTLWLDLVSLFPPTYQGRANGNRIDLMEKLAAMHPQFLRFPGGNYLEGNHIAERFVWEKTIGPRVDRPGHPSPWGYWSTDGLGLLEFFDWCQDLHMQPVLAVYAGYSLMGEHVAPGPDLEPYVQSALNEIEYATGSTSTKWGSKRAADGHPEPFHIQYVEIGNEDWFDKSGSYDARFAQFYKAIKAKYPDIQLIATAPIKSMKPDVLDEHYYLHATDFFHDATHYDKTDRKGPKIFVGEWATIEGTPTPDFDAALGDAAWMTGLERNSDIVVMASYAPLLVNVSPGAAQWFPDLIGYDALRSYGSPSYYAQVMFANHLGNETLVSSAQNAGTRFFYSITEDTAKKCLYLKLVNATTNARTVNLEFPGAQLAATGKVISLSANSTQATNSMEHPTNIVPQERVLPNVSSNMTHTMPPLSIEVLELDLQ